MKKTYRHVVLFALLISQCVYAQEQMVGRGEEPDMAPASDRFASCFVNETTESDCWQQILTEPNAAIRYDFGAHYANGDGVKQDFTRGRYWIHQAALKGYPLAQYNLGVMFFDGIGGIQNQECAVHWLNKAASEGNETREMAQQALAALSELTAATNDMPKVYRALTAKECEQLPEVTFPGWEIDIPQDENALESQSELDPDDVELHGDAPIMFSVGLDVLSANLSTTHKVELLHLEPKTIPTTSGFFREKMGQYFIQLGHQLLGQEASSVLDDSLHNSVDKHVASKTIVQLDESEAIEIVDIEPIISEKSEEPAEALLVQDEPLFIARILDHPVGIPYEQLDVMAINPRIAEDEISDNMQEVEISQPRLSMSETSSIVVDLPAPEVEENDLQVKEDTDEAKQANASPTIIPSQDSESVEAVLPEVPTIAPRVTEKKVSSALNLGGGLRGASKNHYTLQISSASQSEPLLALAKKQKLSNYLVYETQRHGRRWYILLYGEYAGMTQAKQALQQLPTALKKDSPWIRSLSHVHSEL